MSELVQQSNTLDIGDISGLSPTEIVQRAENEMLKLPQVEIPTRHYFIPGSYAREITIPKGTLLTGHTHLLPQINIISKGDITVLTENGPVRVTAPATIVSPAGSKRIGYAHEETVWTTILGVPETDVEEIERKYLVNDALRLGETGPVVPPQKEET